MMLMPSGTTAAARPCSARPTIIGTSESATGVATEAASRVAVTAQAVSEAGASRSFGSSGTMGMTSVCISETTIPARASTATTAFGFGADDPASAGRARVSDMAGPPWTTRVA
jgi:hypothetical protein